MDYKEYLAVNVLNESQTVHYRMLSRALKIHSSRAKQCLYDFYSQQTKRKPASVTATYLLIGKRQVSGQVNGFHSQQSDGIPPSSPPFPSSSMPDASQQSEAPVVTRVVILAKEADLDNAKATLTEISSIHIYSLSATPPKDLQTLSECSRRVMVDYASEDPLENWAQYGVIQNDRVWRRTRKGQPVTAPPAPSKPAPAPAAKPAAATVKPSPPASQETKPSTTKPSAPAPPKTESKPAPTLKRERSSIMSSFARTQPPKPKPAKQEEADTTPALSDDEADDAMDLSADPEPAAPEGKDKSTREAELRAMMDMSDDEPTPVGTPGADDRDAEMLDAPAPEAEPVKEEPEPEPQEPKSRVENGRRRGRRRIMKKKTVKDEEGYLGTFPHHYDRKDIY